MFVVALPISSAAPPAKVNVTACTQDQKNGDRRKRENREHVKQGQEVGKRAKELQKLNKDVQRALAGFEKNAKRHGHAPKLDEAFSVTLDPAGGSAAIRSANSPPSPFRKAGFKPQATDYSGYGVEMIFIPSYVDPWVEWQGTGIINTYDPSGAYLGQYVADVAMVPDPTFTYWDVIYEVSYQDGGALLQYGNDNFDLGTPARDQPEFLQVVSTLRQPDFVKASFGMEPQRAPTPRANPPGPKMKQTLKCTAAAGTGAAVICGFMGLFSGGALLGPCVVSGYLGSFVACGIGAILG